MNFALEELRQVDLPCYKNKQIPFLLFFALRFFGCVAIVRTFFFCTQFGKHQNFALSKSFGIQSSLLSPHPAWQTSKLAFSFSQAYVFHVRVSFFTSNLNSKYSTFALSTINLFSADAFAEGYNAKITCCVQRQDYE